MFEFMHYEYRVRTIHMIIFLFFFVYMKSFMYLHVSMSRIPLYRICMKYLLSMQYVNLSMKKLGLWNVKAEEVRTP